MARQLVLLILLPLALSACKSSSSDAGSSMGPISSIIDNLLPAEPNTLKAAQKQIAAVAEDLNKDTTYAITTEDNALLATEGLLETDDQLKTWVK